MLTSIERAQIEDLTGITPDQLRRLERTDFMIARRAPAAVAEFRSSAARMPFFGCPSEAH